MPDRDTRFDVIVIGAGMAGASVAAELSKSLRVALIEREGQPGYHTTGRSAALFTRAYGPPVIRALSRASYGFLSGDSDGAAPGGWLTPRDVVFTVRPDQAASADELAAALGDHVSPVDADTVARMVPILRPGYAERGLLDPSGADIDVHGVHQHFLKALRAAGGTVRMRSELVSLTRMGADWEAETTGGVLRAPVVVDAAGAWADEVAAMAGVRRQGLVPKRRTALLVSPPQGRALDDMAMVVDVDEAFYLKPDAGKLLISPADETPSPPCDAQPDEMDVAICVDRIERAFDLPIRRIEHKWAGLRSFVPDGCPVAGYDPKVPGFFWLAGQGGYGIQSAPALARAAAALVQGRPIPADIADEGVSAADLAPRDGAGA